ncbi:hypothetical protein [Streptomyces sp. SID5910]|uniref:hypothetical protein n=1 Tax=Streptomyces sp. SID5910 TaxID=2690312 RepID=UPI0013718AAA|nr:hypothetical protein [Streptomyces sp. SID5910]MYR42500.1 hypothetical protein [Streptomyces sp. SID5910]
MSARRRIVVVWAGLCLAGLAATAALRVDPYADGAGSPGEEPTPTESYAVVCEAVADDVAEERRAGGEGGGRTAPLPSPSPQIVQKLTMTAVPEECVDELEARGLMSP